MFWQIFYGKTRGLQDIKMNKTPASLVMTALHGDIPQQIPFTVYAEKIPQCTVERDLRNRGLCIVKRIPSYKLYRPNVRCEAYHYTDEKGRKLVRTVYSTPYGDLSTVTESAGFTVWRHEYMFKSPDDYKALLFLIRDTVLEPNYDEIAKLAAELGEDFVLRDTLGLEPLQTFVSSLYFSMESFCIEWMDNRDEILKLYEAQCKLSRQIYQIVANGPLAFANYGGNVTPQVIGVDTFRKYYVPHYNEAAAVLHEKGKLIGCHFDADNTPIMDAIGETDLDYIEAYDPGISPPVKVARQAWQDKVLWINWPSASHLEPVEQVKAKTKQILSEAAPGNGFLIGITEDVPRDRWQRNFIAIMEAIEEHKY